MDDERVRACDLVFEDGGGLVGAVGWGEEVIGEHYHRSPRLAASFIAREDATLEWPVLWFEVGVPGSVDSDDGVVLVQARCFDRFGDEVASDAVRLEGGRSR